MEHNSRGCDAKSCPLRGSSSQDPTFAYSPHIHSPMRGKVRMQLPQLPCSLMSPQDMIIYQCPTAQQNHKDNKALKPAVFHYLVAGFPQVPPSDPEGLSLVHSTAWGAATQACEGYAGVQTLASAVNFTNSPTLQPSLYPCPLPCDFAILPTKEVESFSNPLNPGLAT